MNKGRNRVKLEVRPRSNTNSSIYRRTNSTKEELSKGEKWIIKSIISGIIILGVFLLNQMDTNFSKGITDEISKAISYQVQWNDIFKSDIISNFEQSIATIFKREQTVSNDVENLGYVQPVNGLLTSEFEEKTHPVFNTKIEPRGVEYSIFENQEVLASNDGIVVSILTSTYQGNRIVIGHNDQYKTIYDGVENCIVEEGQEVKRGESIGTIEANEEQSKLFFFEVWKDNVAVDPYSIFSEQE